MSAQKTQLIVNMLGADRPGILSKITSVVSQVGCNILDSRLAIYGEDFSLTMIIEGEQNSIANAEGQLNIACRESELLCLMKHTKRHSKQSLAFLVDLEFAGIDTPGVIQSITSMLIKHGASVNALRQTTFKERHSQIEMLKCNMVVSLPDESKLSVISEEFECLMERLDLIGTVHEH